MAAMIGTEKQIRWARTIAATKECQFYNLLTDMAARQPKAEIDKMAATIKQTLRQTNAAWWIERRDWTAEQILKGGQK